MNRRGTTKKVNKKEAALSFVVIIGVVILLGYVAFSKSDNFLGLNFSNDNGVKVVVLEEGNGEAVGDSDVIAINYVGSFEDGEVFESNAGEEPFVLNLAETKIIPGWRMGVEGMKVGEKRKIKIGPEYAYGEKGIPGVIPPYATLVYEVDLIAINN